MPTPKQQAKESITAEKHSGDKYSVESLRANMSTGGGEPIPAGKKRTHERRVLQPRDPDTGQFEFNSSALYGRKYPDRSKPDHAPIAARGWILNEGIKKGDKVNIDGKVWIAIRSINKQELINYFKKYNESAGEFSTDYGAGKNQKLSSAFIRKLGRTSKEEKAGIEKGERVLGKVAMSSLSKTSKEEMRAKMKESMRGFNPEDWSTIPLDVISPSKLAENEKFNKEKDLKRATNPQPRPKPNTSPQQKPQEKPMGEQEEEKPFSYDYDAMERNPQMYYTANKAAIDKKLDEFNKKNNKNWTPQMFIKALLKAKKKKS